MIQQPNRHNDEPQNDEGDDHCHKGVDARPGIQYVDKMDYFRRARFSDSFDRPFVEFSRPSLSGPHLYLVLANIRDIQVCFQLSKLILLIK